MKGLLSVGAISTVLSALASVSSAASSSELPSIVIKGSKFFYPNGTQFYMRGVAYQADVTNTTATGNQQFVDPLSDPVGCKRDIPLMQALGINIIRVYAVDTTKDHTTCMTMLQQAGIYIVADLSEPGLSINRDSPAWNLDLLNRYTSVVDVMANYTNVVGFFAGNEVTNNNTNTNASPFVKAAIRDTKKYIASKKYRSIPVGYATNDDPYVRGPLADYFNCGNSSDIADFYGYNIYSWCGMSSLQKSGYDVRTTEYANYSVPVFFAEFGCNEIKPRPFTDVEALYGSAMNDVWSGGIVYMYFQEANEFGLVQVTNGEATTLTDYNNLKSEFAKVNPTGVQASSYTPTNTASRSCPTNDANWKASNNLPPSPDKDLCDCMFSSLSCTAASNVDDKSYDSLFSYVCSSIGKGGCDGISANGTTGLYGSYSICSSKQRLSWAFNQYYVSQNKDSTACNFNGNATVQTPSSGGSCASRISSAGGAAGTTVSISGNGGSSGTSGGSSSSTSTKNASPLTVPPVNFALFGMIITILTAFLGGAGCVLI